MELLVATDTINPNPNQRKIFFRFSAHMTVCDRVGVKLLNATNSEVVHTPTTTTIVLLWRERKEIA